LFLACGPRCLLPGRPPRPCRRPRRPVGRQLSCASCLAPPRTVVTLEQRSPRAGPPPQWVVPATACGARARATVPPPQYCDSGRDGPNHQRGGCRGPRHTSGHRVHGCPCKCSGGGGSKCIYGFPYVVSAALRPKRRGRGVPNGAADSRWSGAPTGVARDARPQRIAVRRISRRPASPHCGSRRAQARAHECRPIFCRMQRAPAETGTYSPVRTSHGEGYASMSTANMALGSGACFD